jgi:hypothetical protein
MDVAFQYQHLESNRHIRLLKVIDSGDINPSFLLVHLELTPDLTFKAISYTWGDPTRVATLEIGNKDGVIGLTRNLSQALPFLAKNSRTKLLWIDQICINQSDPVEKPAHVARMSKIYHAASRVIVWLGPEDHHSKICKEWLHEVDKMICGMENSERMTRGADAFNPDVRFLVVRSTFKNAQTNAIYCPAIRAFWTRQWFTRGWIVQELLLSQDNIFLTGELAFTLDDLQDLQLVPPDHQPEEADAHQHWFSAQILMNLAIHPFRDPQPMQFLRIMHQASGEFQTSELADRLYAFLGLLGSDFKPDYRLPFRHNLIRFAVLLAQRYQSLNFLSMWSANLDDLLPSTPEELKGLPSWVSSWSSVPLSAPFRLAMGGVRSLRDDVRWDAADKREHLYKQSVDLAITGRLEVRGKIVDYIDKLSSARFHRYWNADDEYMIDLVEQIRNDLGGLYDWRKEDMIQFLNIVSHSGNQPTETIEEILGTKKRAYEEVHNMSGYNESLSLCLSTGRGRRFARTESGTLGLVPYIGSKARQEDTQGSAVAILHGCIVPIVLDLVREGSNEYKVVGDCYVEGIMRGERVDWADAHADTFVLV